ncbi:MAG: helix-turn-helix domain-containing protein [Nitratireductor sp.]
MENIDSERWPWLISQGELANFLGTSRLHLSTIIGKLKNQVCSENEPQGTARTRDQPAAPAAPIDAERLRQGRFHHCRQFGPDHCGDWQESARLEFRCIDRAKYRNGPESLHRLAQ